MFIRKARYNLLLREKASLEDEILRLRDNLKGTLGNSMRLKEENADLYERNLQLMKDIKNLKTKVKKLQKKIDEKGRSNNNVREEERRNNGDQRDSQTRKTRRRSRKRNRHTKNTDQAST